MKRIITCALVAGGIIIALIRTFFFNTTASGESFSDLLFETLGVFSIIWMISWVFERVSRPKERKDMNWLKFSIIFFFLSVVALIGSLAGAAII